MPSIMWVKQRWMEKDGNNYKITYTSPEGIATTFFIDAVAYLLTRMVSTAEMQGQQVEMNISLSDYTKVDGNIPSLYNEY